jgi:hypothetical protein
MDYSKILAETAKKTYKRKKNRWLVSSWTQAAAQ